MKAKSINTCPLLLAVILAGASLQAAAAEPAAAGSPTGDAGDEAARLDATDPAAAAGDWQKPTDKNAGRDYSSTGGMPVKWNETYIGYRYGDSFRYPGVAKQVKQDIYYLHDGGGFKYGSYAFNADYLKSDKANPENNGKGGAQEVYSIGRIELSGAKIFGWQFHNAVVRDVGLTVGYEWGVKNDAFSQRARMLVLGPTIDFAVPRGYLNLTVGARRESNYNGIMGVDVNFRPALHAESAWMLPFQLGSLPFEFRGFASFTGPKGRDGFHVQTTNELLARASVMADVGSLWGSRQVVFAGVGYQYWRNAYGTPESANVGTQTRTPMLMAEVHF